MKSAYLILTDSGGIQEEAPSLGKPVLVMREVTERPEAVDAGTVILFGTDIHKISQQIERLLLDKTLYQRMSTRQNPYGDGKCAARIVSAISHEFNPNNSTLKKIMSGSFEFNQQGCDFEGEYAPIKHPHK